MKQFAIVAVIMLIAMDVQGVDSRAGHIYNFTHGIEIYRDHQLIELDYGVDIFKEDIIIMKKGTALYIENCTGAFNELIILTRDVYKLKIKDVLSFAMIKKIEGPCLIQKQFINASDDYLGINLRGGNLVAEFKTAEKKILDGIDENSEEYPVMMLRLLTLYLGYNKIPQVKETRRILKELHPESDYLKTIDAYILRVGSPSLN